MPLKTASGRARRSQEKYLQNKLACLGSSSLGSEINWEETGEETKSWLTQLVSLRRQFIMWEPGTGFEK